MKKIHILSLAALLSLSAATQSIAQKGPNSTEPTKRTKVVRECEYEIVPGLAEITSVKVKRTADKSVLEYDEHEVWFKFQPMEGDEVIEQIKDTEIEFVLRSGNLRVPVGPEYIEQFRIKEGTKYAMNLLQTRNREACMERFTYESKALTNDLFEADREDRLYNFKKNEFAKQLENREKEYEENKIKEATESLNKVDEEPIEEEAIVAPTYNIDPNAPDYSQYSDEELRAIVAKELEEQKENGSSPTINTSGVSINEDKIREEARRKLQEEYEDELERANQSKSSTNANTSNETSGADAIKEAKRKVKEAEKQQKEEERLARIREEEQLRKKEEIKLQIEAEERKKIEEEIEARKEAATKAAQEEERLKREELERKRKALEKKEAIRQEMVERINNETARQSCTFQDRVKGVIEVVKVSKVTEASQSYLGHTEYEVMVTFRPDNYAELSKKDRKQWETPFVFSLDPMSQSANPGAGYIRKYKVFKASQYEGFAQIKSSGICNPVMVYSPDLPNDASKIKLK